MSDCEVLAERASRFREAVLDVARGPGGMIIAFTHFEDRKPFQEGAAHHWWLVKNQDALPWEDSPKPTLAEWYYGENTLWATGWLLWSQILRYRATQAEEALETARKCFQDLSNIFRLCREIEPGLLGKPHGGGAGPTTSFDQSACPVLFYVAYAQEMATPEEKALAMENMALHGEWYLRRDWVVNHHGKLTRIVPARGTSVMKYLACVHAAYDLTGESKYRDAAFTYMRQLIEGGKFPFPSNPYEVNHNHYYYGLLCDYWNKTGIAGEADWIGHINTYWQAMQAASDAEGLIRTGSYDTHTRTFTPRSDYSATCYPNSPLNRALSAALALLARLHSLDDRAGEAAKRTLLAMDENTLRWWWDDGNLPEDMKDLFNIFAPEVAGAWLVAYWMGRLQKVW